MKKIFILFVIPFALYSKCRVIDYTYHDMLTIRAGNFFFTSSTARQTYGSEIIDLEVENNFWFFSKWSFWQNYNIVWNSGRNANLNSYTSMNISTISIGIKKFFKFPRVPIHLYLGAGPTLQIANSTISSPYLPSNTTKVGGGVVGKFGFLFQSPQNIMIDAFFDYYYQPTGRVVNADNLSNWNDIGGFRAGGGIGYLF